MEDKTELLTPREEAQKTNLKGAMSTLALMYLSFFALTFLSSLFRSYVADLLSAASFLVPIVLYLPLSSALPKDETLTFHPSKSAIKKTALYAVPTLYLIMSVSIFSELFFTFAGLEVAAADIPRNVPYALLSYALIPAFFEEMIFRVIPLRLLLPYSKRGAVFISAVIFALMHGNVFSIPHAFVAGVLFAAINVYSGSHICSFLLHFLNNALSVFILLNGSLRFMTLIYVILLILCLAVSAFTVFKYDGYRALFASVKADGSEKAVWKRFFLSPLILAVLSFTVLLTICNLFR